MTDGDSDDAGDAVSRDETPERADESEDGHRGGADDDGAFVWDEPPTTEDANVIDLGPAMDADDGGDDEPTDAAGDDAPLGGLAEDIRDRRSPETGPSTERSESLDSSGTGGSNTETEERRADAPESAADSSDQRVDASNPTAADAPDPTATDAPDPTATDAPLGGLAEEVRSRQSAGADDETFREMSYREIESERLWDSLDEEAADDGPSEPVGPPGPGDDEQVIPKRTCETCPYLSAPPEVACTHDGTEILELVGVDEHRVVNCPMADSTVTTDD